VSTPLSVRPLAALLDQPEERRIPECMGATDTEDHPVALGCAEELDQSVVQFAEDLLDRRLAM
jgi:hypothetical protein